MVLRMQMQYETCMVMGRASSLLKAGSATEGKSRWSDWGSTALVDGGLVVSGASRTGHGSLVKQLWFIKAALRLACVLLTGSENS